MDVRFVGAGYPFRRSARATPTGGLRARLGPMRAGGSAGMAGNALSFGSFTNGSGGTSMPKGGDINLGGVSSADVPYLSTTVVTQASRRRLARARRTTELARQAA
jgi:hypothetical protein